jgi:hypothetical protein
METVSEQVNEVTEELNTKDGITKTLTQQLSLLIAESAQYQKTIKEAKTNIKKKIYSKKLKKNNLLIYRVSNLLEYINQQTALHNQTPTEVNELIAEIGDTHE